jgi:hypothetical protein
MRVHLRSPQLVRRASTAVAAAALTFAMLGSSALAAPPVVRDHIESSGAAATNSVCVGTLCTATSVFVIVNSSGPSLACLDISRFETTGPTGFVPLGFETGCAPLAESGFSIDTKGLTAATLAPINITLQAVACDAAGCTPTGTRTVQVSATYTGVGDLSAFRANSKSAFGACTMYFVGKGSSREAAAALTVDGRSLDALGSLLASTQKIKVLCH